MSEIFEEVSTFEVTYKCDKCGEGFMKSTGVTLMCSPPRYPHICSTCGENVNLKSCYPKIVYKAKE